MVSLKNHNLLDYALGAVLIVVPWLFGFASVSSARSLFILCGGALLLYSAVTNSHYSFTKALPLGLHMTLDTIIGLALMLGPGLFGYRSEITGGQYAVHLVFGLAIVASVALTKPRTEASKTSAERAEISGQMPLSKRT
jgi:hypothetical protein